MARAPPRVRLRVAFRVAGRGLWTILTTARSAPAMPAPPIPFAIPLLACLGFVLDLPASPDFSQSAISVSSESPPEAELVRFTLHLKNSGGTGAEPAQIEIEWPLMGFFVGVEGLGEARIDEEARTVVSSLSMPPSSERIVTIDVLAPRGSGGDALTLSLHLAHYFSGAEHWDRKTVVVGARSPGAGAGAGGGIRVLAAGWWVLAWFGMAALIWVFVFVRTRGCGRIRTGSAGVAACLAVPLGFWMIFAAMAWRDYRVLTEWSEATATIVGRRDNSQTVTSSRRSPSGASVSTQSEIVSPEFALEYEVAGETIYSTGYDTGSSIRVGGRVRREAEMREWVRGAKIPCWYDPTDPKDVVVRRGFGGAYVFALVPLPVFWIGLRLLRRKGQ